MNLIPEHCILSDNESPFCVVKENGKKYTLDNKSKFRIQKIKIDKCIKQQESEGRCDYLMKLETSNPKKAIFIDLKGSGVNHALKQVYDTIEFLKSELNNYDVLVRIVSQGSDISRVRTTIGYQQLRKHFKEEKNFHHATNGSYLEKF